MRIWVQADVTAMELNIIPLIPLKTNQPCQSQPLSPLQQYLITGSGLAMQGKLSFAPWEAGIQERICCQLSVKLLWHQSLTILHSWKQLLHDFHLLRLFSLFLQPLPLFNIMKMSRLFLDPLAWAHSPPKWKWVCGCGCNIHFFIELSP